MLVGLLLAVCGQLSEGPARLATVPGFKDFEMVELGMTIGDFLKVRPNVASGSVFGGFTEVDVDIPNQGLFEFTGGTIPGFAGIYQFREGKLSAATLGWKEIKEFPRGYVKEVFSGCIERFGNTARRVSLKPQSKDVGERFWAAVFWNRPDACSTFFIYSRPLSVKGDMPEQVEITVQLFYPSEAKELLPNLDLTGRSNEEIKSELSKYGIEQELQEPSPSAELEDVTGPLGKESMVTRTVVVQAATAKGESEGEGEPKATGCAAGTAAEANSGEPGTMLATILVLLVLVHAAESGSIRSLIPGESDRGFRLIAIIDSRDCDHLAGGASAARR